MSESKSWNFTYINQRSIVANASIVRSKKNSMNFNRLNMCKWLAKNLLRFSTETLAHLTWFGNSVRVTSTAVEI